MGIRIHIPSGENVPVKEFTEEEKKLPSVQLVCDLQNNEHKLLFKKAVPKKNTMFIVEISVSAFRPIALNGTDDLRTFAGKLKAGRPLTFSSLPLRMNTSMLQCIHAVLQYESDEPLRQMFMYSKIVELFYLQQECYAQLNKPKAVFVKTEYDRERLVFARDYLLTHMDAAPSLPELAAIAGINEFKLKTGFRELFNNSVFGYLAEVRLQMACTALKQKKKSVTQIAFQLGYASIQHFSAAFKKKYGVSPAAFAADHVRPF
jgi:AraC-like DNA-binding protein